MHHRFLQTSEWGGTPSSSHLRRRLVFRRKPETAIFFHDFSVKQFAGFVVRGELRRHCFDPTAKGDWSICTTRQLPDRMDAKPSLLAPPGSQQQSSSSLLSSSSPSTPPTCQSWPTQRSTPAGVTNGQVATTQTEAAPTAAAIRHSTGEPTLKRSSLSRGAAIVGQQFMI